MQAEVIYQKWHAAVHASSRDNKYMATALLALRKKLTRQDVMAEVPGDHCFFVRYSGTVVVTNFTGLCTWPGSVCVAQVTGIAGCRNGR